MIVKDLLQEGCCFAIIQSKSYLTKHKYMARRDYEIIGLRKDLHTKNGRFMLKSNSNLQPRFKNPKGIVSTDLNQSEVSEFAELKDTYFETIDFGKHGKVYQLKDNPFNEYYYEKRK